MDTYFVRHNEVLDITDADRDRLWDQRRIAIHFPEPLVAGEWPETDSTSLNPHDYPLNAKRALGGMLRLAASGGYVYAEYTERETAMIGYVEPHSQIEFFPAVWGDRNGRSGKPAILKSLQLARTQVLGPEKILAIGVARPLRGTLMRWPNFGSTIQDLIDR